MRCFSMRCVSACPVGSGCAEDDVAVSEVCSVALVAVAVPVSAAVDIAVVGDTEMLSKASDA